MAKQTFTTGQVLTAAQMNSLQANDYNWTVDTKTASYVLVAGDAGKRIVMNAATATTITVDTSIFTAGDVVWIHNINTGTCTVTAGTATVNTAGSLALAQWEGGALYFTSASTAIYFPSAKTVTSGVIQVKSATKTDSFTTSSTTFTDLTGVSVSITPTSASNKIFVTAMINGCQQVGTNFLFFQLVRDSTAIAIGDTAGSRTRLSGAILGGGTSAMTGNLVSHLDSPATTSATTYKLQVRASAAGTIYVNRNEVDTDAATTPRGVSSITVFEVLP